MSWLSVESPGRREALLVCLVIVAAVGAIYAPVRGHEFVDLDAGIVAHPAFEEGLSAGSLARHFTEPYQQSWVPLHWVSLHLSHALHGGEPAGTLLTNVALHALASLLLFGVLWRLTSAFYCAAFVALFFAVHPLHVESVAWASQRKDVLGGVFFMAALWAHARFAAAPGAGRATFVALLLGLGLLSTPMLVTLPFVLLLLDFWPLGRLGGAGDRVVDPALLRARIVEKWPLFALVGVVSVATWVLHASSGALAAVDRPFLERLANGLNAVLVYLSQTSLPQALAILYPYPEVPDWAGAGASAVLLAGSTAIAVAAVRDRPYLLVGWLWFVGMLVPVIGLVPVGVAAHADRYVYLPQIGLSIALAWGAAQAVREVPASRPAFAVVGLLVLGWFGGLAWQQTHAWQSSVALYARSLAVTGGNPLAQKRLADALLQEGNAPLALLHYQEASALQPGWMEAELALADVLVTQGRLADAIPIYQRWAEAHPEAARPARALGLALQSVGRFSEALPHLDTAIAAEPDSAKLHAARGVVLFAKGEMRGARDAYREALRLDPAFWKAAGNLAWLLAVSADPQLRDPQEAVRWAEAAVEHAQDNPALLDTLAAAYAAVGRFPEAVSTARRAVEGANAAGSPQIAREMAARLRLYYAREAYVEER